MRPIHNEANMFLKFKSCWTQAQLMFDNICMPWFFLFEVVCTCVNSPFYSDVWIRKSIIPIWFNAKPQQIYNRTVTHCKTKKILIWIASSSICQLLKMQLLFIWTEHVHWLHLSGSRPEWFDHMKTKYISSVDGDVHATDS